MGTTKLIYIVTWCAVAYISNQQYVRLDCAKQKEFSSKDSAMVFYIKQIGNSISTPCFKANTYNVRIDSLWRHSSVGRAAD